MTRFDRSGHLCSFISLLAWCDLDGGPDGHALEGVQVSLTRLCWGMCACLTQLRHRHSVVEEHSLWARPSLLPSRWDHIMQAALLPS